MHALRNVIGSLRCLRLLWLAREVALFWLNCFMLMLMLLITGYDGRMNGMNKYGLLRMWKIRVSLGNHSAGKSCAAYQATDVTPEVRFKCTVQTARWYQFTSGNSTPFWGRVFRCKTLFRLFTIVPKNVARERITFEHKEKHSCPEKLFKNCTFRVFNISTQFTLYNKITCKGIFHPVFYFTHLAKTRWQKSCKWQRKSGSLFLASGRSLLQMGRPKQSLWNTERKLNTTPRR